KEEMNCRVRHYQVQEYQGYFWVANPEVPLERFPKFGGEEWVSLNTLSFEFKAPLHVVLDNFSENEHFPYVHKWFGWDESGSKKALFKCQKNEDSVEVSYWGPQRDFTGQMLMGIKKGQWFSNRWRTQFDPVRTTYTGSLTTPDNPE